MFLKSDSDVYADLTSALRDATDWNIGTLRTFQYPTNIAAFAFEPVAGILAIGTTDGSIVLFGSPGVECKLNVPDHVGAKFLQFAPSLPKLACLDTNNQLHVWDLETFGRPKLVASAKFDPANSLTTSPSHSHAFVGLQTGIIKTYDLLCHCKSPYTMPNMWALYEEKMSAGGMIDSASQPNSGMAIDVVPHPRDLNRLFVAYGGGIILSDLTERNTLRAYELIIPPGAPGSAGYASKDLFTVRKSSVTAISIHPSGHFFVVGYADGVFAFWAVDDEDQPLLVRTLDDLDVNQVDGEKIEQYLPHDGAGAVNHFDVEREPIYRLSWSGFANSSDPRGGSTCLSILGGNIIGSPSGVTVFSLPPFNPAEPPAMTSPVQHQLHVSFRNAMRESCIPAKLHLYEAPGIIQDFLLLPRDNPHYSGTFDPFAMMLLFEGPGDTRLVEALEFPPPAFHAPPEHPPAEPAETDTEDTLDELATTLNSMALTGEPAFLRIPNTLDHARGLLDGQLVKIDKHMYQELLVEPSKDGHALSFRGGIAYADLTKTSELKLAKYQPRRILITYQRDLTVKFDDISAQLLIGSEETPLSADFPDALPHLTIDLGPVVLDPAVTAKLSTAGNHRIESVQLAPESLECIVGLQSGELLIYRPKAESHQLALFRQAADEDVVILSHVPTPEHVKYHPYLMLAPRKGPFTAYAICDIGFFAAAYPDGSLIVVDMRGPTVILRHGQNMKAQGRHSIGLHISRNSIDPIGSLTWTICKLKSDAQLRIRLVAARVSGQAAIFTVTRDATGHWVCSDDPALGESLESPLPGGSFVISSKTGAPLHANSGLLSAAMQPSNSGDKALWIICGSKGARCFADITGDLVAKTSWGTSKVGSVRNVQLVEKNGSQALIAITEKLVALVYSLPKLEHIHTLQLPGPALGSFTGDDTGDFILWKRHPKAGTVSEAIYGSLFDIRRAYSQPDLDFVSTYPDIPPQPQPVSLGPASLLGSWFSFGQQMSGDQLDSLLGGPDRPMPKPKPEIAADTGNRAGASAGGIAASAAATQNALYSRLQSAIGERGQMLGDLEQSFNALEEGSRNMVTQAKRLAAQQTAKGWFSGFR
ncbi:hypothetical protein HGRIS_008309 [Hohenbuehelia grisea]|uniref:Lethal giant larvae (Lgl)-like C-terminal domain-containing protein n=1 Tax=Hohenbuehelia grisea TaxID=104357 RepID=A0ABR3J808_9AGAR